MSSWRAFAKLTLSLRVLGLRSDGYHELDALAVSVKIAYYARAELAGLVPPTVFMPKPAVDSALVRLVRRNEPPVDVPDVERLFVLVRAGFATRRKMLRRALTTELGSRTIAVLEAAGIDPSVRAETLGLEEWASIARVEADVA